MYGRGPRFADNNGEKDMSKKNVILVLFEESGVMAEAYRTRYPDYEVRAFDILRDPSEDVRLQDWTPYHDRVRGIFMFPPCTEFALSGARWWKDKAPALLEGALGLVWECARVVAETNPDWYALENPVGRLKHYIGDWDFTFDPYEFAGWADDPDAEAYTKRTCIWGQGLNRPTPDPREPVLGSKMHRLSSRAKRERSKTPQGFARAFADANP